MQQVRVFRTTNYIKSGEYASILESDGKLLGYGTCSQAISDGGEGRAADEMTFHMPQYIRRLGF